MVIFLTLRKNNQVFKYVAVYPKNVNFFTTLFEINNLRMLIFLTLCRERLLQESDGRDGQPGGSGLERWGAEGGWGGEKGGQLR